MKHLLSTRDLSTEDIVSVLAMADHMAEINSRAVPKVPALRGRTVASVFFEDSTRTRLSFETAATKS
jgi:aspartate carbamoyltransferase catalytic subunit